MNCRRISLGGWVSIFLLGLPSCASVPKETVALSMAVGEDIQQLYSGYKNTVRFSFAQMRRSGLVVIDEVWTPAYLRSFVREGELLEIAREENWEDLQAWARAAIEDIDAERSAFVEALAAREMAVLAKIDESFDRTISANAAVTAHLNSVLKVQGLQAQVLDAVGLRDLRDEISNDIAEASNFAADAAAKIRDASARLGPTGDDAG